MARLGTHGFSLKSAFQGGSLLKSIHYFLKKGAMFRDGYRGKRVLVTGHTGFKGSWLSQWLVDLGAEVTGYSLDLGPSGPSHFKALKLENRVRHILGDVRDFESLQKAFLEGKPEIVFHLAAQPIVKASYDDPRTTFDTNLNGTVNVLEAVRKASTVRAAVFVTSDKCYENVEWEFGYRENDRLGGKDPYSASKACAEIAVSAYQRSFFAHDSGPAIGSVRAGNVIGGGDWAADRIVPDCMRAWAENKEVSVRNPASTRPWQHVLEPLSGYLWLGTHLLNGNALLRGEAFNFGPASENSQSVQDLILQMQKQWQESRARFSAKPQGVAEAKLLKLCCDKALQYLKWLPCLSFSESVGMTVDWYKKFYSEKECITQAQIQAYCAFARDRGIPWASMGRVETLKNRDREPSLPC